MQTTAALIDGVAESLGAMDALARALNSELGVELEADGAPHATRRQFASRRPVLQLRGSSHVLSVFGDLHWSDETLFRRRFEEADSAAEAAAALISHAWGGYVAFLEDRLGSHVIRDPSGAIPLYVARFERVRLASTHITPRLLRAAGLHWRIDEGAVAKLLANPPAAGYLSGLSDVEIAVPGRLVSMTSGATPFALWSPAAIARRRLDLAPQTLAAALDDALKAMTRGAEVGVELSGGFDSSVVCSSIARLGMNPKAFNFATAGRGGDEARYARDVAVKWSVPLRTFSSGTDLPDYRAFDTADHGVQPILHGLDGVFARARTALVEQEKVDMVLTGQGGDALFFRLPTRLVALDRRRECGITSLLARETVDDARRVGGSIWSVIATGLGRRAGDDRPDLDWAMSHLLGPAARKHLTGPQPKHPWVEEAEDLPPGKIFHLMMLSHCQLFHGRRLFPSDVPIVHPLLAQPLMEMTSSCPTYVLQSGPLDRGLARQAFRDRLPTSVLTRRSKGEASDHYARAVLHNRSWLREHLLGGRLTATGLLDPVALERALDPGSMRLGTDYRAFVQYASLESWMRYWS